MNVFTNADEAFDFYFDTINKSGEMHSEAKAIFNECFLILDPLDNEIKVPFRKWNKKYAEDELEWYKNGDNSLASFEVIRGDDDVPAIWYDHANEQGKVMSNYGWQWQRRGQLQYVIQELRRYNESRRALVTLYDGKEHKKYTHDTPCTLNYHFQIYDDKLHLTVMMRSNDIVFGFCNDQFVASELLRFVAEQLEINVGTMTWFASNLHLYPRHFDMRTEYKDGIKKRV